MGQSNSRAGPSRSTPSVATPAPETTPVEGGSSGANADSHSHNANATVKRSRRASLRRSVLGLVTRSSQSRSLRTAKEDSSSAGPSATSSMRRRWRSSKRFSHTPTIAQSEHEDIHPTESSSTPVSSQPAETSAAASPKPASTPSTSNSQPRLSRPSTPFPVSPPSPPPVESPSEASPDVLSDRERQLSQNIGTWLSGAPSPSSSPVLPIPVPDANLGDDGHSRTGDIEREINEFLGNTPASTDGLSTSPEPASSTPAQTASSVDAPSQQPPRHFPPPGTLVVVQGVVNTTDAPSATPAPRPLNLSSSFDNHHTRPSENAAQRRSASVPRARPLSSIARSEDRPSARTGLSSLLPRPHSMISRWPSSEGTTASTSSTGDSGESPASDDSTSDESATTTPNSDSQDSTTNPTEAGHRALSPGSIDVLGTLLSVAATATAASLFSPGLGQTPHHNAPASSPSGSDRPTSPTPTAGLGGFGGLGSIPGLNLNAPPSSSGDRDARERIRNVWENFRERLGLHPRNASGATNGENSDNENNARMRPGEFMLAEMARALNAGLGLANQNAQNDRRTNSTSTGQTTTTSPSGDNATAGISRPVSPEAGFERFLVNLQNDLRAVLSSDGPPASHGPETAGPSNAATNESGHSRDSTSTTESFSADPETESIQDDEERLPSLVDSSDDEDEDEEDAEDTEEDTQEVRVASPPPRTPTPIPSSRLHQPTRPVTEEAWGTDDRGRPSINLWRIYRFQPIPAPGSSTHGISIATPSTSPGPSSSNRDSTGSQIQTSLDGAQSSSSAGASTSTAGSPLPSNVVVPVIVVGLQSVDTGYDHDHTSDEDSDETHRNATTTEHEEHETPASAFGIPRPSTPRGRTWQSRAANALRTLRPGRRNGSQTRNSTDPTGSRTFLIYVIGGYYPPNHHMVTGSDNLDSYEALWELAELLGQVKPPVATKEEIDKSGLEIIKASTLRAHEAEGKVSSNCTDKCLICLDEYSDDDDVRVMQCRHAFHKDCVDKWLQVGRNNCPACRSKGVSTPADSTPGSIPQRS